jgi:hypothetical protein
VGTVTFLLQHDALLKRRLRDGFHRRAWARERRGRRIQSPGHSRVHPHSSKSGRRFRRAKRTLIANIVRHFPVSLHVAAGTRRWRTANPLSPPNSFRDIRPSRAESHEPMNALHARASPWRIRSPSYLRNFASEYLASAMKAPLTMFERDCDHKRMPFRRPVLLVALACLLLNALDCYGASLTGAQARKCCASGHCSPANLDSCCKNFPAGTSLALELHPKISVEKPIPNVAALDAAPVGLCFSLRFELISADWEDHPPPRDFLNSGLPLRI